MGTALGTQQQRVARRVVAGVVGIRRGTHQSAVAVLRMAGGDAFRDDGGTGVLAHVDHLRAGVGLLIVVGDGDAVELGLRVVTTQDAGGVFPRDGRARLHLRPRQLGVDAAQVAALGDEVQHAALAVLVAGIPVLHGRVFHLGTVHDDNLDDGGMQLVLVAHGSRTAFEVADVGVVVGHDEGTLKLTGVAGVDAEVAAELHRTAHSLGDIDERAVGEDRRVEGGKEVVTIGNDGAQILSDQVAMLLDSLADGAEDDALLAKLFLEGGLDADGVHDGIDRRIA